MPDQHSVSGPFVQVACICALAIQEPNGSVSVVRIIDRMQIAGTTPQMQPQPLTNYSLVVVLKAGDVSGSHTLKLVTIGPTDAELARAETSVLFEGEERGMVINTPLALVVSETGLYWIELYFEDQLLTRIPLRVLYNRIQLPPGFQPPTG